ncbi:Trp biosynthesis associated, transmembrane protein, Oprn/Chp [Segniliparus rotundus DSM 44985]|uniref:Trp biosynthesis associated, transmembrane protein, Oprn/Chp n=1 Tax=Segniliparus rotundus (strain ATCC BAA-972 / CDC 1076 / CIP 108378 / DSM 44985 / JCM 13578) TaxID=640132 RepID=D6ZBW6_SEGRD|nr:Trp biosynthesis-associated membrane protein [Segniliparus rotundus]ADG96943.1 Trp biosynthesis associated, transmembrane protein, Oprn/Chp [Segniliparus rotundus DSM 44985]
MKRPLAWASLLLVCAGAGAYGSSRATWAVASAHDGLGAPRDVRVLGSDFAPLTIALALLLIAAVPAVFAVKGWTLRAVALAVGLAGAGLVWAGAHWLADKPDSAQAARLAALPERYQVDHLVVSRTSGGLPLAAGAMALGACVFILRAARAAQGLGSRFDSPAAKKDRPEVERSAWAALDAGEDPTL